MDTKPPLGSTGSRQFYMREVWQIGWNAMRGLIIVEAAVGVLVFLAWIINKAVIHLPSEEFAKAGARWLDAIPWWLFLSFSGLIFIQLFLVGNWKSISTIIAERDQLRGVVEDRVERFRAKRADIADQPQYLKSDTEGQNVSVTAGQTILDEVTEGLFDGRPFRHKLQTRVNALTTRSYPWQRSGPHKDLSTPYCMFLGYMSVKDQEPDVQYLLNPEVQPTLRRIEWGLRQLIDDFDSAIGDLDIN